MKGLPISDLLDLLAENLSEADFHKANLMSCISSRISIERIRLNMNQSEFAKFMSVSQGMVSKWESGNYNFTIEALVNIFTKLKKDIKITIEDKDQDYYSNKVFNLEAQRWKNRSSTIQEDDKSYLNIAM